MVGLVGEIEMRLSRGTKLRSHLETPTKPSMTTVPTYKITDAIHKVRAGIRRAIRRALQENFYEAFCASEIANKYIDGMIESCLFDTSTVCSTNRVSIVFPGQGQETICRFIPFKKLESIKLDGDQEPGYLLEGCQVTITIPQGQEIAREETADRFQMNGVVSVIWGTSVCDSGGAVLKDHFNIAEVLR